MSFPHLSVVFWDDPTFPSIHNNIWKFIGITIPKAYQYSCVIICMEVDLSKELQEEIQLNLNGWLVLDTRVQGLNG